MKKVTTLVIVMALLLLFGAARVFAQSSDDKDKPCHKDSSGVCTSINVPFIPQTGIANQMLQGIRIANEEAAAKQRAKNAAPPYIPIITTPPAATPATTRNGTYWIQLSQSAKMMYAVGLMDGMGLASGMFESKPLGPAFFRADGNTPTNAEVVSAVDALYSKPEYLPLCTNDAVVIEWMSLTGHGISQTDIGKLRDLGGQMGCD